MLVRAVDTTKGGRGWIVNINLAVSKGNIRRVKSGGVFECDKQGLRETEKDRETKIWLVGDS